MLDLNQAEALVDQLRSADRSNQTVDPTLPLQLARARREVESAFSGLPREVSFEDISSIGIVAAGLSTLARWLKS
jgi:hypothetical protein